MAGIGANLGAGLSQGYSESANSGGSVNSAQNSSYNVNNSYNSSWNDAFSDAASEAYSWTDADTARMWSAHMADVAWKRDMEAFQKQMDFNREEAQKQRDWQAEMANTIYTRSVKNMKEAGINPILAYNMGLSGAGVGSGATASLGGSPSAPLAQNFMDSWSASNSNSHSESHGGSYGESWGEGYGEGWQNGSSWNSGWSNSEEGIVTALQGLSGMADTALAGIQSGKALEGLNNWIDGAGNLGKGITNQVVKGVKDFVGSIGDRIQDSLKGKEKEEKQTYTGTGGGGGHGFNKKMKR